MPVVPAEFRLALGERVYRTLIVGKHLRDIVEANPITKDDQMDLNPHLNIKHLINKVIDICKNQDDLEVDESYVMLYWLTLVVYHGKV